MKQVILIIILLFVTEISFSQGTLFRTQPVVTQKISQPYKLGKKRKLQLEYTHTAFSNEVNILHQIDQVKRSDPANTSYLKSEKMNKKVIRRVRKNKDWNTSKINRMKRRWSRKAAHR